LATPRPLYAPSPDDWKLAPGRADDTIGRNVTTNWDDITRVQQDQPGTAKAPPSRDQAYVIVLAGNAMGEMFKLSRKQTIIGRGQTAHIRMMDEGVSREHCEIEADGDTMILHDLGSTNGTYCRGTRVDRHILEDGDKILVGSNTVLKFTYHDSLDEVFQRQMYESALRDDLTKAFNKKYFTDRLESEFAFAAQAKAPLSLVVFDLDHFKLVNDTYGHPVGDQVLAEVAGVVANTVRAEDVFARVGGEEFAVICQGTDMLQAQAVAERMRQAVAAHRFAVDGQPLPLAISAGVAAIPEASLNDAQALIAAADQALYEAKRTGRNRVCCWRPTE
jgi:diguanylate cyclase (GGDEF)-like protein